MNSALERQRGENWSPLSRRMAYKLFVFCIWKYVGGMCLSVFCEENCWIYFWIFRHTSTNLMYWILPWFYFTWIWVLDINEILNWVVQRFCQLTLTFWSTLKLKIDYILSTNVCKVQILNWKCFIYFLYAVHIWVYIFVLLRLQKLRDKNQHDSAQARAKSSRCPCLYLTPL